VSLGIASQIPNSHNAPHTLTAQADQALYSAKEKGRNTYVVYNDYFNPKKEELQLQSKTS
jgi:PleD family two-component response regulator